MSPSGEQFLDKPKPEAGQTCGAVDGHPNVRRPPTVIGLPGGGCGRELNHKPPHDCGYSFYLPGEAPQEGWTIAARLDAIMALAYQMGGGVSEADHPHVGAICEHVAALRERLR